MQFNSVYVFLNVDQILFFSIHKLTEKFNINQWMLFWIIDVTVISKWLITETKFSVPLFKSVFWWKWMKFGDRNFEVKIHWTIFCKGFNSSFSCLFF